MIPIRWASARRTWVRGSVVGDQVQQAKRDPSMLVRAHLRTRDDIDCFFEWPSLEGAELNIRHLLQRGYQPAVPPSGEYAARLALLDTGLVAILLPGIYELPHHAAVSRLPRTEGRPQRDNGARRG